MLFNIDFLLNAEEPWVVYRTLTDLVGFDENNKLVQDAKNKMLDHNLIKGIIEELQEWPGKVLNSHKSAGQLYHKLSFIADIGIKKEDADFSGLIQKIKEHVSEEGLFQLPTNIPTNFGGTGQDIYAWALCDAPLIMYSTVKIGLFKDEIRKGLNFLISLERENGWPCKVSRELGKFRGPGKKEDPCPYVNLIMLKLLSLFEEYKNSREARIGAECLLGLWEKSRELHPYMFFMGTDFRKLKAPFIWYDILHTSEVLSSFDFAQKDERLIEMVDVVNSKADEKGLYIPESEWKAWNGWDFGQKKRPSPWLTFIIYRINKRLKILPGI